MQICAFDVLAQKQLQLADARDYVVTLRDAWRARLDLQQLLAGSRPDHDDVGSSAPRTEER
jgi:hypothetical protein